MVNDKGLDVRYAKVQLGKILQEIELYTPEELARALRCIAEVYSPDDNSAYELLKEKYETSPYRAIQAVMDKFDIMVEAGCGYEGGDNGWVDMVYGSEGKSLLGCEIEIPFVGGTSVISSSDISDF